MEKHFLQNYEVHKKPEALKAAKKKEKLTGQENLTNDSNERITAYVERMENIFLNPDEKKRERNIKMLKPALYDAFVIKPENFPESYFEYQKKLAREERGLGDIEFTQQQKEEEIQNNIVNQQKSLDSWMDYLSSDDNPYSADIKFFVMQGVLKLGKFDIEKYSFSRRMPNDSTVAPFPEIDREALAKVMGAINFEYKEGKDEDYPERLKKMIKDGANFGKLYAEAMRELDESSGGKNWEETEGEWRKFDQNSDSLVMQKTLEGKRSNLCIASGDAHAQSYLNAGDMHIYYSKDRAGDYTMPRVAISMQNGVTWEVRGTYNKNEDTDPYITDIVDEKLKTLPEGEKYNSRIADMKQLTAIEKKYKNKKEELNKDDLRFLYEIDSKIDGFGYNKDPRIKEILSQRNIKSDISLVTGFSEEQISLTREEALSGGIKFHYGDLNLNNLQFAEGLELPETINGGLNLNSLQSAEGLNLPKTINGYIDLNSLQSAEGLKLPETINGDFNLSSLQSAEGLKLPETINGYLDLRSLQSAEGLKLPETINGGLYLSSLQSAEGLKLPETINGGLNLNSLQSAEGLNLPETISDAVYLYNVPEDQKTSLREKYPDLKIK